MLQNHAKCTKDCKCIFVFVLDCLIVKPQMLRCKMFFDLCMNSCKGLCNYTNKTLNKLIFCNLI